MTEQEMKLDNIRNELQGMVNYLTDLLIDDDFHPDVRSVFRGIRYQLSQLAN